ncbi:MAG: hypothetical protein GX616_07135 [Planctomycetes bacterium]|nr:hypothetical protein [Planctomycetota bacterium]
MGEFVRRVSKQAKRAMREIFGQEPLPGEIPLLELMSLLLGDGFGEVQPTTTIPITSQQWFDWHHLALMKPEELIAAMNLVLETGRLELPRHPEAMRTWAACLMLSTLDQLDLM